MGLDMYLKAELYLSNYAGDPLHHFSGREKRAAVLDALGINEEADGLDDGGVTVLLPIMYWRKANAIHGWFVDHCQGGEDDCRTAYVSHDQLQELVDTCEHVLRTNDPSALEPCPGFFFGDTAIDGNYWNALRRTADGLRSILNNKKFADCGFHYHSSW